MNYYIDFDNTVYETAQLTQMLLETITTKVEEVSKRSSSKIKNNFNSTIDNIFDYARKVAIEYNIETEKLLRAVREVIDNGEEFVFEDAKRFLEKLKERGDKAYVLTYVAKGNQEYQMRKLIGSGLIKYFEGTIITTKYKFLLDLNYRNGIFIDDDPRDLNGLFEHGAKKVIRIRKPSNRRSRIEINNPKIEEYISFDDIQLPKEKSIDF